MFRLFFVFSLRFYFLDLVIQMVEHAMREAYFPLFSFIRNRLLRFALLLRLDSVDSFHLVLFIYFTSNEVSFLVCLALLRTSLIFIFQLLRDYSIYQPIYRLRQEHFLSVLVKPFMERHEIEDFFSDRQREERRAERRNQERGSHCKTAKKDGKQRGGERRREVRRRVERRTKESNNDKQQKAIAECTINHSSNQCKHYLEINNMSFHIIVIIDS